MRAVQEVNGVEALSRGECMRFLAEEFIGRLAVHVRALPVVVVVNFVLVGETIVVRTGLRTDLASATNDAVVAFQADRIDRRGGAGWSVTVTGVARELVSVDAGAAAGALELGSWAPGEIGRYAAISTDLVAGHRCRGYSR